MCNYLWKTYEKSVSTQKLYLQYKLGGEQSKVYVFLEGYCQKCMFVDKGGRKGQKYMYIFYGWPLTSNFGGGRNNCLRPNILKIVSQKPTLMLVKVTNNPSKLRITVMSNKCQLTKEQITLRSFWAFENSAHINPSRIPFHHRDDQSSVPNVSYLMVILWMAGVTKMLTFRS